MSWDGDEADRGWDTYMDRLIAREEASIRADLERVDPDTEHYLGGGGLCVICARAWPCPAALLGPEQLELGAFYRGTDDVRPNPDYL